MYRTVDVFCFSASSAYFEELVDCVNSVKGDLLIDNINCTKLQSRYQHLYSSFWVAIRVDTCDVKKAIELFLSTDAWPMGVLARRYFIPKNG